MLNVVTYKNKLLYFLPLVDTLSGIMPYVCVPVSKRSDDQSVSVPQVFIAELELGVADVNVTLSGFIIPAMT